MHSYKNNRSKYSYFLLIFVAIKVGLNLLAISRFGFQRDELLHLTLGDHLDWGFKEVPPFIAVLAKITTSVFGNSVFAARIFSTIFSGLIIWFTGQIVIELGGKKFAITLACLALIFSPAFAASGYLFQPVVFDQLWWVLTVYLLIRYMNTSLPVYIYLLGIVIGIGLLTKYTMAFFAIALMLGLLLTRQRKLLWNKHVLFSAVIALTIFLPNIIWQMTHHLPVVTHMKTLRSQQLEYIKPTNFIIQELLINGIALFIWLTGFGFLLFSARLRRFQFLAFAFILIFIFLLAMKGKEYYLFGAFPMLFAAGGYGFERWMKSKGYVLRTAIVLFFTLPNLLLLPLALPIFSLDQTMAAFRFMHIAPKWEDQKEHYLSQDYADMLGWDEMTEKVAKTYNSLTPEQQKHTQIYADNYGEAGAIHHIGKQYNLPDAACLNSSFTLWTPDSLNARYIIYVDETNGSNIKKFQSYLESYIKIGEIDSPYAREKGTGIFLLVNPKPELDEAYRKELAEKRLE
ncbi:glycosyltransferase family 39 protein [Mucilaginibacter sp. BT774]|uniref:ArnT family glycosyltransferase n=1 Tax=Mucilaginibacter sp. BT774 TaxID=3062276 RepID=UPI002675F891|nr:glycosyltransferase family 39 protein [Mucilaginibacter sp. BT774]MDO3628271.1 glycosyltransferase family 39 protein [Mucilaginibacter sp. BT774]